MKRTGKDTGEETDKQKNMINHTGKGKRHKKTMLPDGLLLT